MDHAKKRAPWGETTDERGGTLMDGTTEHTEGHGKSLVSRRLNISVSIGVHPWFGILPVHSREFAPIRGSSHTRLAFSR